jgi:hypothetical protein
MQVVERLPLMASHTFAEKDTLQIRIGEVANLRNIKVKVTKSCKVEYKVAGETYYAKASNLMHEGWKVHTCICRENNNTLEIPQRVLFIPIPEVSIYIYRKMLIIRSHLVTCQGMLYIHMRSHGHLITDNILQEARDFAKNDLFGDTDHNVLYSESIHDAIIAMGHSCKLTKLGFAMLFGNEDMANWICFWKFIKSIHPIIILGIGPSLSEVQGIGK